VPAAITYALTIDGTAASPELLGAIQQIEMEDHAGMADMLRLRTALSVRQNGSGWTVLDDAVFGRLTKVALSVTVGTGSPIPLITGYVIETAGQFANDPNGSTLAVVAMDSTVLMHLEEKVKAWPNMADSDVATAIFGDAAYGFTPVVEATNWTRQENEHTLLQRGTDVQFLKHLAERNGYECYLDLNPSSGDVEGHFHPPRHNQTAQGTLTVNMGAATNVNRFRTRYEMLRPVTAQATTLDVEDGSDQSGQANSSALADLGATPAVPADRPRRVLLSQLGMGQSAEVQRYAQAAVDRSAWAIVAEGEVNTAAYGGILKAKQPVLVRGVGTEFSGQYYVERVLHVITSDGSYVQRFTLRRNAVGLRGNESFAPGTALAS